MKTSKKESFSNVYSPHQQSVMSNIEKMHSPLPNNKGRKTSTLSSISPIKKPSQTSRSPPVKVSQLSAQKVDNFKSILKAKIGKQKIQKIREALDIQREAQIKAQKRIHQNKSYFHYNQNPFTVKLNKKPKKNKVTFETQKISQQKTSILTVLNILQQNKNFKELKNKIDKYESDFINLSNKLTRQRKISKINFDLKSTQKKQKQNKNNQPSQKKRNTISSKTALRQLDKIVCIEENNFFQAKRNKSTFNLFKVITDPDNQMFLSGSQQLQLLNFSFDSWVGISNVQFNSHLYKNLSHFSRIAACKHFSKAIPSFFRRQDLDYQEKKHHLQFNQLILIANGRFINQNANYINKYKDENSEIDTELEQRLKEPSYKKNQVNRETKGKTQLQKAQIQKYMQNGLSDKQKQLIKDEYNHRAKFRELEKSFHQILKNNIFHIPIRNKIAEQKEKIVKTHLYSMNEEGYAKRIEQKIRRNKVHKDKTQEIKIDQLRDLVRRSKSKR